MATSSAPLNQVTVQVRAMQKAGLSERRIAAELKTTRNVVHTILTKGAQVTRGKAKLALLRWIGAGAASQKASTPKRPVGRPPKAARPAMASAPRTGRRRRRRGGRRPGRPSMNMGSQAAAASGAISLEMNGMVVRLRPGRRYVYRDGALYHHM